MEKQNKISSNLVLAEVSYQSTWTTCTCGRDVELKKNSMGWKVSNCECKTQIRQGAFGGKMIVERNFC